MAEIATGTRARAAAKAPGRGQTHPAAWRDSVESLLVTLLMAVFATCFVVQAFNITSQSMEPTLLVGDHLLVNKFIFESAGAWYERFLPYRAVRRGDVIIFKFPFQDHPHYVKRVIGVPGDRIHIVNSQVYVNGKAQDEPYAVHDASAYDPFAENFPPTDRNYLDAAVLPEWKEQIGRYVDRQGELVVPPGHYFAMGDNRDHSWDSRYWGFVSRDAIMGRPVVIYWPSDDSDQAGSRWRRMLAEVH